MCSPDTDQRSRPAAPRFGFLLALTATLCQAGQGEAGPPRTPDGKPIKTPKVEMWRGIHKVPDATPATPAPVPVPVEPTPVEVTPVTPAPPEPVPVPPPVELAPPPPVPERFMPAPFPTTPPAVEPAPFTEPTPHFPVEEPAPEPAPPEVTPIAPPPAPEPTPASEDTGEPVAVAAPPAPEPKAGTAQTEPTPAAPSPAVADGYHLSTAQLLITLGALVVILPVVLAGVVIMLRRFGWLPNPIFQVELIGGNGEALAGATLAQQGVATSTLPTALTDEEVDEGLPLAVQQADPVADVPDDYEPEAFDIGPTYEEEKAAREEEERNRGLAILTKIFEANLQLREDIADDTTARAS